MNTATLTIEVQAEGKLVIKSLRGDDILVAEKPCFFLPEINGVVAQPIETTIQNTDSSITFTYTLPENSPVRQADFQIKDRRTHLELSGSFTPQQNCVLNSVRLLPAGCLVNMYKLFNFRNRHCTEQTAPELLLGEAFETTTDSSDWQFAPHPSMYTFTKNSCNLFLGALDLPTSFGLDLEMDNYRVCKFSQNYGGTEQGLQLTEGQTFETGRFALFASYLGDPLKTVEQYNAILVAEGYVPNPAGKQRFDWHTGNLYCTWIDQGYRTEMDIPKGLHDQIEITASSAGALNDKLVQDAIRVIEAEKLDFTTILIDMGWSVRGEWIAKPEQFSDLRKLVDWLHSKGYRVVVWWNWAEVDNAAPIPEQFLAGGGVLNKHGQRTIDFSNPATQEEYLKPLFHRLFSSDEGCYNFDGVKTDFLSDKIHPETLLHSPEWRGEENYFYRVFELFFKEMRRHKPDAVHIGCAGHPYLAQFIDINRTYDVWSTNVYEHVNRGKMLRATSVGCAVAYDFHHFEENFEEYLLAAYENGCSVQIGNVLGVKKYPLSRWYPAGENYYSLLRKYLPLLPRR